MQAAGCPLCEAPGGSVIFAGPKFRVIRADEPGFPAFYRVVWNDHVTEFSDLAPHDRIECIEAVVQVEASLREHLSPLKVNLATLGNSVPHLHWHVIARFAWDTHYPGPVWGPALRGAPADALAAIEALLPALESDMSRRFNAGPGRATGH
jgi:diadenosine tetraphosphate (Ap4A) HIT family hydrolase